jgi:hypothetical protein
VKRNSLSIVLPVRNAAERLPSLVAECLALAAQHSDEYELIVVLDGSDPQTVAQATLLAATHAPVALQRYARQRGFRAAFADALSVARGEAILVLDHQQVTGSEAAKLLVTATDQALALGYRTPAPGIKGLAALLARTKHTTALRDPGLRLALVRADLRDLLPSQGPDQDMIAELYAGVQQRGLPVVQVAVSSRVPAEHAAAQRRGARVGAGVLAVAGALWLIRRWRPGGKE